MSRKHRRKFVTLLLALSLFGTLLSASPSASAADRPAASKLASGHLLIGTYLIQKEALTNPVLDAAKASIDQSDQGMYYKSELADGAWFNIQNGYDLSAILNPSGTTVANADIDKMKINIWVRLKDGKVSIEWLDTAAALDKAITDAKDQQKKAEEANKQAVAAGDDTLAIQLAIKAATLRAQVAFLEALKAGNSEQAGNELEKLADPQKLLESAVKGAQADLQKQLEAELKRVEDALASASDPAEKAKLLEQKKQAEKNLNDFKAGILSAEVDKAITASKQLALELDRAVNNSQAQLAKELLVKLDAADQQLLLVQRGLLAQQVSALEKRLKEANGLDERKEIQAEITATKQSLLLKEKAAWQAEFEIVEGTFQKAEKLGQKDIAAQLLAKLNTIALRIDEIQAERKVIRMADLQTLITALKDQIKQAKEQGAAESADNLLVSLVEAETALIFEEQGVADSIEQLVAGKQKLTAKLPQASDAEAVLINQEIAVLDAKLLKAQKTERFLLKEQFEKKQMEVKAETGGKSSPALDSAQSAVIEEIKAIERQKYTANDLSALADLQKQIKVEQPKATVLPVENVISKTVDIKFMMPPLILGDRTLMHIRPISESFGSTVTWNQDEQSVWISKEGTTVYCKIGEMTALVNGKAVKLDAPPRLIAGRTVVPLRFVVEALGLNVVWHDKTQAIEIKGTVNL
ncbi:hypothetical protein CIG75_11165 [Tumebacillus algifaecis]|uniref:Copper amine oxidase-like N-terminal domain-containing protein n=1 Tax=Tumebacillus algifaecis TaxID=1214604 RepID=A0A223D1M0_9BACL|nr:copper amine oxidase N-terminal domain-containing protein [Tumebacillus algifaecis]ASS75482.1 hypothetical protein CIG75_11165 [Tumebacillus algifaecis]